MRLMWCIIMGVLALETTTYGNALDCPESTLRRVQQNEWVRCNEENQRRMEELKRKNILDRDEQVRQVCCVLSDTMTCWVDSLRSECGDASANELIRTAKFKDDCASWRYPDSISQCHLWYTKWWFITIVAILAIVIIAAVVFLVLRKRVRSAR